MWVWVDVGENLLISSIYVLVFLVWKSRYLKILVQSNSHLNRKYRCRKVTVIMLECYVK